jgi:hypothetical protein
MSVFLLGAAPSLRAGAHADCGKPIPDSERRLPSAIAGTDIPNDTVFQIKSVVRRSDQVKNWDFLTAALVRRMSLKMACA